MATWAFTLTIDSTPYDLTPYVDIASISRERRLFSELRPNLNKCSFRCLYDATTFAALIAGTVADIAITKDGSAYFTGTLSPNYRAQIRDGIKLIELIAEDYTLSRLGETIRTPIAWAGYALCTPAAPTTSIIHAIAALAGVTVSASVPVLSTTIPYLVVTVDEKKTLAKLLEDILFDYSYVYRFEEDGELMLTQAVNTGTVTTTGTLTTAAGSANILGEPTIEKAPEKYDDIRVRYNLVEAKTGITLFEDKSGATETNSCEITLEATGDASGRDYYPLSNKIGEVFSAWNNPDGYKIWIATSATLDDEFETGITLDRSLVNYYKKCSFGYVNGAGAAKKITKLKITGNAYVIAAQNTARASLSSAKLLLEYEAAYIFTDAAGQAQAKALAQYYAHSDLKITAKSKTAYTLGQYVLFADALYAGISVKTRVIGIRDTTAARDVYEYALEAVADFSAISLVTEGASPKDAPALDAAASASAEITAEAARSRAFATVALISAATAVYDYELAYCLQTATYWRAGVTGTAFVDTGATVSSSGLVAAWLLDEVPDIPDSAAGTTYVQDAWATVDGWATMGADTVVSVASGELVLTAGASPTTFVRANKAQAISSKTVRVKWRSAQSDLTTLEIGTSGAGTHVTKSIAGQTSGIVDILTGANFTDFELIFNSTGNNANPVYVDWIYVGTGAYTTPAVDNSGKGKHLTLTGPTPDGTGRLIFDGVNDIATQAALQSFFGVGKISVLSLKVTPLSATAGYIVSYPDSANNNRFYCYILNASYLRLMTNAGVTVDIPCATNEEARLLLVRNNSGSGTMAAYKNGILMESKAATAPAAASTSNSFILGAQTTAAASPANCRISDIVLYDRIPSASEILGLGLGLRPSLPYRLTRWQVEQAATDGIITPIEKKAISALWYAINGNGSTTGRYWTAKARATTLSVSYADAETARNALYAYLYTTPAILLASTWNMTITITKATYEALWSSYDGAEAALLNAIAAKEGTNAIAAAAAAVPTNTPHYKGRYLYASRPTSGLIVDDTCTLYSTTAGERGIYKATNATTLVKQTAPTTEMIADAWADIMWIDNQVTDYGVPTDYTGTGVDFVDVLGANVAFMNKLFAQYLKIQSGGSFRAGDRFDETGALDDATKNGAYIGADGAFLLEGTELSIDEDRIRSYRGAGVQRRAVQVSDESLDWLDTPDTTPASDEFLQARIGRLGVGGNILMDGEFDAGVTLPWGAESVSLAANIYNPAIIQMADGELRFAYRRGSDSYLCERVWSGSAWGAEAVINGAVSVGPKYIQLESGELRLAYIRDADDYCVERIWSGSAWGDEAVVNGAACREVAYGQLQSGELRIAYIRESDDFLIERIWSGSAWGAEAVINGAVSYAPNYITRQNGELLVFYMNSSTYLCERIWSGSAWGDEAVVNGAITTYHSAVELINRELRVAYKRNADGYLVERIWSGSAWGDEAVVNGNSTDEPQYYQFTSGELTTYYRRSSDGYLCERRLQRYAQLGAGIISYEVDANDNEITKWSDGRMEVECKLLAVSRDITTSYQEGYYATESWTLPTGFTAVSWADCKYISAARIVNASVKSLSTSTIEFYMIDLAGSATVTVDVLLKAVGRWK